MINEQDSTVDVLECVYNFRIRESDQLKTVLELHELGIRQGDVEANLRSKDQITKL